MFLDASAIVAILTLEDDHKALASHLEAAERRITSAIAIYEAALAVARKKQLSVDTARREIEAFLERVEARVLPIESGAARSALAAYERFGKGTGHPARLNMGDCFAYAMAKQHNAKLLYKGDDFARTDLA